MSSKGRCNMPDSKSQTTDLLTITLDWKSARMVAGACVIAAELEDTDPNDARVLHDAWAIIMRAVHPRMSKSQITSAPTSDEWQAALRVIAVASDIRDIMFGSPQSFPKLDLVAAVDAFLELREINNG
jgi:hypothetical protein